MTNLPDCNCIFSIDISSAVVVAFLGLFIFAYLNSLESFNNYFIFANKCIHIKIENLERTITYSSSVT